MSIFIISDTHFSHKNIIEWGTRPIFYEDMIQKELQRLKETDMLIHLGDFCMGKDKLMHEKYISPIAAKKVLVRGNHDHKTYGWYLDNGWDFACESFVLKRSNLNILFTHKPSLYSCDYDINIHGHLHDKQHRIKESNDLHAKNYLVSLEFNGYTLENLDKILNKHFAIV